MFRALDFSEFTTDPFVLNTYTDPDQAIILLFLRDSLDLITQSSISYFNDPIKAYKTLQRLYKPSLEQSRDTLY
jgi:hypothetical protein